MRFKPKPPEPKGLSMQRTRFVNSDICGLEERFYQARVKFGLGTNQMVRQMIEHCLNDLEDQQKLKPLPVDEELKKELVQVEEGRDSDNG